MSRVVEQAVEAAGLRDIHEKVMAGKRLSHADGVRLFRSRQLMAIGVMADQVRRHRHDRKTYFVRNMHLNPTNVCTVGCRFCGYHRPYSDKGSGWAWSLQRCLDEVAERMSEPLTEVHIVGGHNPDYEYDFYLDLIRGIRRMRPGIHIKAFTAAEYDFFARRFDRPLEQVLDDFIEAGLGSIPGGGAEILTDRIRDELYPGKISADRWLEVVGTVHRRGLRSNATMLYGHIETVEERIEHICRLRELQDHTGGFMSFIPLAFQPEGTAMGDLPGPTGFDDLLTIAVARLMLDNFDHIKAYWVMCTPPVAQTALNMGADCIDGTVSRERVAHMAGATSPTGLSLDQLLTLIREAGMIPVERDSLYNVIRRFEDAAEA